MSTDKEKLYVLYLNAFKHGDITAQDENGIVYFKDNKVKELFETAISNDDPVAINNLGCIYLNGMGVNPDYGVAKELLEMATRQGQASALTSLGHMYQDGKGVEKDSQVAKNLFEMAVQQNVPYAQKILDDFNKEMENNNHNK